MTMGIGMALMEESVLDTAHGDYLNRDLAGYHVPANADCPSIEAHWTEEHDRAVNPLGIATRPPARRPHQTMNSTDRRPQNVDRWSTDVDAPAP
jgi:hypothetical protein